MPLRSSTGRSWGLEPAVGQRFTSRPPTPPSHPAAASISRCHPPPALADQSESKGGSEATVKVAKRDLVPTSANLLKQYASFTELVQACAVFSEKVIARAHRETRRSLVDMLSEERPRLHVLPVEVQTSALGRTQRRDHQTIRVGVGALLHARRPAGREVCCRVVGDELVSWAAPRSAAVLNDGPDRSCCLDCGGSDLHARGCYGTRSQNRTPVV